MRLNELPIWMAICLAITVTIEAAGAFLLGVKDKKGILNVILINVATNPFVVVSTCLVGIFYGSQSRSIYEYAVEAAVVIIEGLFYMKVLKKTKLHPMLLSLVLNAATYGTGLLINIVIKSL